MKIQKLSKLSNEYENYRWFYTSNDILVVGGKSDEQNEQVIRTFSKPDYIIMHTTSPGSPFMIVQSNAPKPQDLLEAAVFCACFSKQWKLGEKSISIDIFRGEQVYKTRLMKSGTFGVSGIKNVIYVKPGLLLVVQKGKLRAIPDLEKKQKGRKNKNKNGILGKITQGNLTKEEAVEKIFKKIKDVHHYSFTKEEIMKAIPSDKLYVE